MWYPSPNNTDVYSQLSARAAAQARLAAASKALQRLLKPMILAGSVTLCPWSDKDTRKDVSSILAFNASLATKRENQITCLSILNDFFEAQELGWDQAVPAVVMTPPLYRYMLLMSSQLACTCMHFRHNTGSACRAMGQLSALELARMEVYLPALETIVPQLRTLRLPGCLLHTGCKEPAAQPQRTTFFASNWCRLELLDMTGASLDAGLGTVSMPQLQALCLGDVSARMTDRPYKFPHTGILIPFSAGCPACTHLECQMAAVQTGRMSQGTDVAINCKGFQALETIVVMIDPAKIERPWGSLRTMRIPATVSRLELRSSRPPRFHGDPQARVFDSVMDHYVDSSVSNTLYFINIYILPVNRL